MSVPVPMVTPARDNLIAPSRACPAFPVHCRRCAAAGEADAVVLRVLALLGGPEDEALLAPLAGTPDERWLPAPAGAGQESMAQIWRSVVRHARPELEWLRREVPDGFFDDVLREDVVPGE